VKKILMLLANVPMLAIPAPAIAQGLPPVGVCQFAAGFRLVETTGLIQSGIATQKQVDRVHDSCSSGSADRAY
jgi:hypothetical protein